MPAPFNTADPATALDQNFTNGLLNPPSTNPDPLSAFGGSSFGNPASLQSFPTAGSSGIPSAQGSSVPPTPGGTPFPSQMVAQDFRVRIAPLNPSFYGTSTGAAGPTGQVNALGTTTNPFSSANGITNTGVSGTNSAGQLPATAPGASNLLGPLQLTGGVLFPYTPTIGFEQAVDYTQTDMIQTNLTYEVYRRTPSVTINIQGKFTVQNHIEGQYAIAAIHFFRVASKMYFGTLAGANAGLPPPILVLNGYGTYMFKNLNCVLKSHSFSYAENMDTVSVQVDGGTVRLPAMFDLNVTLVVQQTPQAMRTQFNLDAFRTGALMQTGGWI
jgi:hypothetical protein